MVADAAPLTTQVLIVGGGPTGLTLAHELGLRGIRVVLIEDKAEPSQLPAANATQARTMEHFRRLGLADAIRAQGLPPDYPTDVTYWTRYGSHELARFALPASRDARIDVKTLSGSWSAAELPHRCSQLYIEPVLRASALALPTVECRFGWRVLSFEDHFDYVSVIAECLKTQARQAFRADYVVGCDGPRSLIRKTLGIAYEGDAQVERDFMGGQMHAMRLRLPTFYERMAQRGSERKAWMYWTFNPERRAFMCALNGVDEFVFHTQLKADQGEPTDDDARAMVLAALGPQMQIEVEVIAHRSWKAGLTLVAERYGRGRVYLAGDAVHLFTPTGGLGYNTGIEDAVNLGWKLAHVLQSIAAQALLDTYETERKPIAVRNLAFSRGFADSVGLFTPHADLEAPSAAGDALRDEAGAYLLAHARTEFNIPGITFGGRVDGSPIIISDGSALPPDTANSYAASGSPGGRAPHAWLPDGSSLYDHFGANYTLLVLTDSADAEADQWQSAAKARKLPLKVLHYPALYEAYGAQAALIRPDQIVAWRGDLADGPIEAIFDLVTAR